MGLGLGACQEEGLRQLPSQYSLLLSLALQKLGSDYVICYLDDILIFSKSREEHLSHLEQVLKAHVKVGLKLNLKKCQLLQDRLVYLGHLVSQHGIEMVPHSKKKMLYQLSDVAYKRIFAIDHYSMLDRTMFKR